jgi:iron complex outermembrane receptor protein
MKLITDRGAGHGVSLLAGWLLAGAAQAATANSVEGLGELSLAELSQLEVTSVSKSPEPLQNAPAAIYVITHDDIARSGATSVAEALRLAPNLQISQYSASNYVAGARGFAGAEDAQNFSNKLLILIDGRSVYSPLFSGVYLDVQDVVMDDVDRIEVISGPGATLWGANAMNGVINVITRDSYVTDGSLLSAGVGNQERTLSARYGAKLGDALAYRIYGKLFERDQLELANGDGAGDDWYKGQLGFRSDWTGPADTLTTQGDVYRGLQSLPGAPDQRVEGGNLLGRWQHQTGGGSQWQLQSYYDYSQRGDPDGGLNLALQTGDVELQQRLSRGAHRLIWGAGLRLHHYQVYDATSLAFDPAEQNLWMGNLFAQDSIALSDRLDLTVGLKFESATYSGVSPLPDLRLGWRVTDTALLWASASRAVRAVTPFDHDVVESIPGVVLLSGNHGFKTERVNAYEIGYRGQPSANLSFSASLFYDVYNDLRNVEYRPDPDLFILQWDNQMRGQTYGFEAWAKWQATNWWRLSPGLRTLHKNLEYKPGAMPPIGLAESGDDPREQWLLTSSMELGAALSLDATLRHVGTLPEPRLKAYTELSTSLAWRAWRGLDLSLSGNNLLGSDHQEYPSPAGEFIGRSVIGQARWRF